MPPRRPKKTAPPVQQQAVLPADDPREAVADFSRPAPVPRPGKDPAPPRGAPVYRPNRIDFERSEFWKERAAIFEYDGGFERWIAERMALEECFIAHDQGILR